MPRITGDANFIESEEFVAKYALSEDKDALAGIASNWAALSGKNNWKGLLDPIDDNLRHYLINYGELTGAVVDAFNGVKQSKAYSLSRYPPEAYLNQVGLQNGNPFKYQVVEFFYGRSEEVEFKNWNIPGRSAYFGFVAVATDEGKIVLGRRDIVVCWRGTILPIEWFKDFSFDLISASDVFPNTNAKVHKGFHSIYTTKNDESTYNKYSAREQVLATVKRLVNKYADLKEDVSITVTGHSLGAALATLNATDIAFNGYNKPSRSDTSFPVTAFAYASPRVGDKAFQEVFNGLSDTLHLLRLRNNKDIVPDLPPPILPDLPPQIIPNLPLQILAYVDVGEELYLDTTISPYIKYAAGIALAHDLNLYLHGIAGYQGKNKDFKLVIDLDLALVNKYSDLLIDTHKVPTSWWSNVFRQGMVQMGNGHWELHDYVPNPPLIEYE